ncbi:hypothetical protein C8Q74DRAFT_424594 [Fomes fomentarius]|nr:hypothetical protein C8Q74DRAFT_424594 [Fomes fomentarius]
MYPRSLLTLISVYHKAALVLWPHRNHVEIVFGARALAVACKKIQRSLTRTTGIDMAVECALAHARPEDCADIISLVCERARFWGDPELWLRAVSVCDGERAISNIEPRNALYAVSKFGLDKIKDCLERTLERDPNISNGLCFLGTLDEMPASPHENPDSQGIKEWTHGQRMKLLSTLKVTEQGHDSAQIIITSAISVGDVGMLETTVLDSLNALSDPALLIESASKVHTRVPRLAKPDVARLTKNALARAILSADLVNTGKPSESVKLAESLVKTSKEVEHEDLIMTVVACIANFDQAGDAVTVWHILKTILLPFINTLQGLSFTTESATLSLSTLCTSTVRLYLDYASASPKDLGLEDIGPLLQAVALTSEPRALLLNTIATLMNFGPQAQTEVLPTLLDELPTRLAAAWHNLESVAFGLAMKYVESLDILIPGDPPSLRIDEILHALERVIRVIDAPQPCALLIERVLGQKQPELKPSIRALLVRLVPHFRKLLLIHKRERRPVYTALYRTLLVYWIDKQMGPRPQFDHLTALLQKGQAHNTCTVPSCERVHAFLISPDRTATHRQSTPDPPSRAHIESLLRTYTGVGVTYDETDQALVITKHETLLGPFGWSLDQEDGAKMVKALSVPPKELQTILGADYARAVSALGLPMPALTSGTPRALPPATYPTALGGSNKGRRKSRSAKAQTQEARAAVASTSSPASVTIPAQIAGGVKRPSDDPATSGGVYFGLNGGQDAKRRKTT